MCDFLESRNEEIAVEWESLMIMQRMAMIIAFTLGTFINHVGLRFAKYKFHMHLRWSQGIYSVALRVQFHFLPRHQPQQHHYIIITVKSKLDTVLVHIISSWPAQFNTNAHGDAYRFFLHSKTGMLSYHEDTLQSVSTYGNDDSSERSCRHLLDRNDSAVSHGKWIVRDSKSVKNIHDKVKFPPAECM